MITWAGERANKSDKDEEKREQAEVRGQERKGARKGCLFARVAQVAPA